ncbi:MAG: hypothetical protein RI909_867 [Bacteroidota bacterium]|jgi:hypothetical protein
MDCILASENVPHLCVHSFYTKLPILKSKVILFLLLISTCSFAQPATEKDAVLSRLNYLDVVPEGLLSKRALVLYDESITDKELEETQKIFQQTGIDAVAYVSTDYALSGPDPLRAFTNYLTSRAIDFLIFFEKDKDYSLTFVRYNNTKDLVDASAPAWKQKNNSLSELLKTTYRFAISNQKKQNLLVNDYPETDVTLKYFTGRRNETFTLDAKSFKIAVVKWGNEKADSELEQILKEYFPVKYELVDPKLEERELANKGYRTVLRFVHTRGSVAKKILEYDLSQLAKSLSTVYYVNGEADIKTIPANQTIYKFYVKHIEYGNIFLGKGWDADITWQDALKNHLQAMREALQF